MYNSLFLKRREVSSSLRNFILMVKYVFTFTFICISFVSHTQIELNASYSDAGVANAAGFGINAGYEIALKNNRLGIKPQIGYKCNCSYYDFTGTDFVNKTAEFHTTFFYKLIDNPSYKLIPNVGLNLRYSYWSAKMRPPLETLPSRVYATYIRRNAFAVSTSPGREFTELRFFTPGYTFQVQNRFKISDKISVNVTPFAEVDYEVFQEVGGGYVGITYNK